MLTLGLDEVGRGCWAGPLVAGAVILDSQIPGLKDSKQLTKRQRERLNDDIWLQAVGCGLGWVSAQEVDQLGLTAAVGLAMQRAINELPNNSYDRLIVDGNYNFFPDNPKARAIIKADSSVPAVSAASIIAKVARDSYMQRAALEQPEYGFEKHVGYGTAAHLSALKQFGVTELHRKSFKPIRALLY